jgi:putative ABC transport system permease protein
MLARHRGFFAGATAVLAASVGLNLIVFTFVNALWLKPLPFREADRLVAILGVTFSGFDARIWSRFPAVAGQVATDDAGLEPRLHLAHVRRDLETAGVTAGYFGLLGLAIRGRDFVPDDDRAGAEPVAIVSDRLWSRELGRRGDVIGAVLAGHPVSVRVIGVAPPGFEGAMRGERTDVWIPRALVPRVLPAKPDRTTLPMVPLARLSPGDSPTIAERSLKQTVRASAALSVAPLRDVYGVPGSRAILIREGNAATVVAALALLVLFGGCAAIGALVLVHYERRRLELAVRAALGATRRRLVSVLSRELTILASCGFVGAVALASLGVRAIPSLSLPGGVDLERLDVSLDWRVLGVALTLTAFTLAVAAWLPLARSSRVSLAGQLLIGPATTASLASQRMRQGLLALLVGATVIVLIAAGLFVRAVQRGFGSAPGFDVQRTVFATVQVAPPLVGPGKLTIEGIAERTARVREALGAIPGVTSVADGIAPIDPSAVSLLQSPVTLSAAGSDHQLRVGRLHGSPELMSALGVPILAGRGLTAADSTTMQPMPAVVTESLARRLWPTQSPLGQLVSGRTWRGGPILVVGVARDFVFGSLAGRADGVVIVASEAFSLGLNPRYILRVTRADAAVANDIRLAVARIVPDAPPPQVSTGAEVVAHDLGRQRLGAWFFSGFGLVALTVGVGSVFGLVAYLAESRRHECGVRLALGATPSDLLRLGLSVALIPVGAGLAGGALLAVMVSRVFTSLLVGVSALDGLTYVTVVGTILMAAVAAALTAAWRLRRVMPAEALRTN